MSLFLTALFFITALLYASVGFGGGSTYNALLVMADVDFRLLPTVALICNIIVVTGGTLRFARSGALSFSFTLPWIFFSVPAAWLGGRLVISEQLFIGLLASLLLLSGSKMLWDDLSRASEARDQPSRALPLWVKGLGGSLLGLMAGLTGIGGGIFLAPLLHMLRAASAQRIAATCSLFILVNSLSGLAGHYSKLQTMGLHPEDIFSYAPLFISVFIGGQIGSYLGSRKLPSRFIKRATAILILYVAIRLFWRLLGL